MNPKLDNSNEIEIRRAHLNETLIKNNLDLLDPEVLKISCELDVIVLKEMDKTY